MTHFVGTIKLTEVPGKYFSTNIDARKAALRMLLMPLLEDIVDHGLVYVEQTLEHVKVTLNVVPVELTYAKKDEVK